MAMQSCSLHKNQDKEAIMFFASFKLIVAVAFVLSCTVPPLHGKSTDFGRAAPFFAVEKEGGVWRRAVVEEHDDHDHDHDHSESENRTNCAITDHVLVDEFNELAKEMGLTDGDGEVCHIEEEEHGHEEPHAANETEHSNTTCPSCDAIYHFVEELLLHLNVTTPCCLGNDSACTEVDPPTSSRTDPAKAYGYGFLMVMLVCLCSLLGVLIIPLLNKQSRFHKFYKYVYALMIALGTSALFCDAVLHLLPEAFGLHTHGPEKEGHAHEEEEEDKTYLWRAVVVVGGLYLFYLFEVALHSWNSHTHGHSQHHYHGQTNLNEESGSESPANSSPNTSPKQPLTKSKQTTYTASATTPFSDDSMCLEPTIPHGACRDKCSEEAEKSGGILHPRGTPCEHEDVMARSTGSDDSGRVLVEKSGDSSKCQCIKLKPLAWVIILGDALHNIADGLALGAATSQSLSLGISTMIAIVFHELPHELGDFVILLSSGLKWYTALTFNFISSLTAIVGLFVGVAIGTSSSEANGWILAATAGIFLYIALVDLLPELIHINEKGSTRFLLIVMANIGFFISFVVLLLIAYYEDQLNMLVNI